MKLIITKIVCIVFALALCTNMEAQNDKEPSPVLEQAPAQKIGIPLPPPPPPPPKAEEPLFKVVEQMPRFPGCEDQNLSSKKLKACSKNKLMEYIIEHLVYPEEAKKHGIEGTAVIQLIVGKDGSILEPKVIRDVRQDKCKNCNETCGEAALKVFKKMQSEMKWIAGKQRGRAVKVQYTIPVSFKL